jgi:hypothetical protein
MYCSNPCGLQHTNRHFPLARHTSFGLVLIHWLPFESLVWTQWSEKESERVKGREKREREKERKREREKERKRERERKRDKERKGERERERAGHIDIGSGRDGE